MDVHRQPGDLLTVHVHGYDWKPSKGPFILWLSSTNVASSGGLVDQLNDSIGFGHVATQTSAERPSYTAGPPSLVTFNGSSQGMNCDDIIIPGAFTFGAVFKLTSTAFLGDKVIFASRSAADSGSGPELVYIATWISGGASGPKNVVFGTHITSSGVLDNGFTVTHDTNYHTLLIDYNGGTSTNAGNWYAEWDGVSQTIANNNTRTAASGETGSVGCRMVGGGLTLRIPMVLKDMAIAASSLRTNDPNEFLKLRRWLSDTARTLL